MKPYSILITGLIASALLLSACANVSRIEKDSLVAYGELMLDAEEPLYYLIGIDVVKTTDEQILYSQVKLAKEAPAFSLAELKPELVAKYLPAFAPPSQWPESWKQEAQENESYAGNGFFIKFSKNGMLLFVSICSHCEGKIHHPIVGTSIDHNFYSLPLTIKQFSEVFGLPTRIQKVREVRY